MKARRLKLFEPSMKISTRYCDYSHQKLNMFDRIRIWFSSIEWVRTPAGKPTPIIRTKNYTYYFKIRRS